MYIHTVAGDEMAGEEEAAEDGGGWDVGDELELPTDLVSFHTISSQQISVGVTCVLLLEETRDSSLLLSPM